MTYAVNSADPNWAPRYLLELEIARQLDGESWVCPGEYFYVADQVNDRVVKRMCSDLSYVDEYGSDGTGDDEVKNVSGVCSDNTYFYITDYGADRIVKRLCSDLTYAAKIGSSGSGDDQFINPMNICTDGTNLYVIESHGYRINKRLCSDLSFVAKIGSNGSGDDNFNLPYGICTDDTYLYVADAYNNRIVKRNCSDLAYVDEGGTAGSGDDELALPWGVCTDGTYIYIADADNDRIVKRNCSDLTYVAKIGSFGNGDDEFDSPKDIATDGTYLYVTDNGNARIVKRLCSDLSYVDEIGTVGSGDDNFNDPLGIAYSQEGSSFYVSHPEGEPSRVEENGTALTERASLALCNANASSWYYDSANERLYVHTSGSDDPGGGTYTILSYHWECLTNRSPVVLNDHEYLSYLNDDAIPDIEFSTSQFYQGGTQQSFGQVRVINTDGRYDERLTTYIYEAKKVYLRAGADGDAYADYQVIWVGWTGSVEWSDEYIGINIEDLRRYAG